MKSDFVIPFDSLKKIIGLAEYLDNSSQTLIAVLEKLSDDDLNERSIIDFLNDELFSLNNRALKIKEELIYAVVNQTEFPHPDDSIKYKLRIISEDFRKIQQIFNDISEPSYYINPDGKLIK